VRAEQIKSEHGDEARTYVAMRADDCLSSGRMEEFGVWIEILRRT
jgi:hypothetical protein